MKIFAVNCPQCQVETPVSTKKRERLEEMKVSCSKCEWEGKASEGIIKEKEFTDWF